MNTKPHFFEQTSHPTILINQDGVINCNSSLLKELGYPHSHQERLNYQCLSDISPERQADGQDSKEKITALIALTFEQGQHSFNWLHQSYSGEILNVKMTLTVIKLDNTSIVQASWISKENKRTIALHNAIFKSKTFSKIATDAQGVIQIFNVGAETMLGFKASEVVNIMTPADLSDSLELSTRAHTLSQEFGKSIEPGFEALVYKAALGIEDIYELTYLCKDGQRLPAQVSVTALRDEDDSIIGYLLIGTDNTARKQIEKDMKVVQFAFESAQSMYITDINGYFLNINQAFTNTTGYILSDLFEKKASLLNSEQYNKLHYQTMWETLLSTGAWSCEQWNKKKNGELILEQVNVLAVKDEKNRTTHYVVNCIDIGQREAYEVGLIDAKEKAERFSTLKSQFIASMSHEIRTPMTAIIGFAQLALEEKMSEDVRRYVQHTLTASTSLLGILQDVLDFTKLEAGRVVIENIPFNILDVLSTIDILFSGASTQKGLTLSISHDTFPIELLGDKLRIQQVLTNLVGNAIKFTPQGVVKLDLTVQAISLSQVQLLFSITDTGIGIAPEDQDKLFVEFNQIDNSFTRKYGGTGLGLVISKELVELMGGDISVISVKNQGSTFSFSLQLDINSTSDIHTSRPAPKSMNELSPPISARFKGYLVLVVEDNELMQLLITKQLVNLGMSSIMTNDGKAALSMLEQYDFDLVLMDVHMPVMNGIEATTHIRCQEKFAHLPIIALTAGVTESERNDCLTSGMNDFMTKPINKDQLCATLELWLKISK